MPHKTLYLDKLEDRNDELAEMRDNLKKKDMEKLGLNFREFHIDSDDENYDDFKKTYYGRRIHIISKDQVAPGYKGKNRYSIRARLVSSDGNDFIDMSETTKTTEGTITNPPYTTGTSVNYAWCPNCEFMYIANQIHTCTPIFTDYVQTVEQTDKEKVAMYMKLKKREIIGMLLECQRLLDLQLDK